MPVSLRKLTPASLRLKVNTQGNKSTMFANMKKDVVLKDMDVLGFSCGDFQSNLSLADAIAQSAKANVSLKLAPEDSDIAVKIEEINQHCKEEMYKNFEKMWPKANKPKTMELFQEMYEYISPLKESEKHGKSLKLSITTTDGTKYQKTCAYVMAEGDLVPYDLADIPPGSTIVPKISCSMVWVFGKKYGPKIVLQEAIMKGKSKRNAPVNESGVFDVDDDDDDDDDDVEPATKKAKASDDIAGA